MADEWDPVPSTRHRGDVVDPEDSRGNGGAHNIDLEKQKPDMVEDEESSSGRCCTFICMNIVKT